MLWRNGKVVFYFVESSGCHKVKGFLKASFLHGTEAILIEIKAECSILLKCSMKRQNMLENEIRQGDR